MRHHAIVYGTWVSYGGAARIGLAVVLFITALGITLASGLGPHPNRTADPATSRRAARRRPVVIGMAAAWLFAVVVFGVGAALYVGQLRRDHLAAPPPNDPITPVTVFAVLITFIVIFIASPQRFGARLFSAAVGAIAGTMIFELPFDLIVMTRTYPPIPPDPSLYRALFFGPLILIEITSLSLLTLSPMARLARSTFVSFALMLAAFAVWSLSGFGYPSGPVPITLNVISKILAFVTVLTLFLPQRARPGMPTGADAVAQAAPAPEAAPATTQL